MLGPLLQALRPHQWVKNLLVFAPLLFTDRVAELAAWLEAVLAFATFCMCASSVYVLNDLVDREEDRRHPKKRNRPIASGALPSSIAAVAAVALLAGAAAIAIGFGFQQRPPFAIWPAAYLALNLAYSFRLKRVVVIDCMCIALGFQLRVHAGAAAIHVATSHWILLCTFFFSLFLAFCKRYEELSRQTEATGHTRATMKEYTPSFLNMLIGPLAALSILSYALYTVSPETVFRYLFLVYRRQEGGDPARLLFKDFPLLASGVMYVGVVYLVLRVW
jgi:4-hydroxybenzoate polyprenyltransferase